MSEEAPVNLIVISFRELSADALRGVIESFILREGTDYGDQDYSLDQKVSQVVRQLERGEAEIVYDLIDESCDLRMKSKRQI